MNRTRISKTCALLALMGMVGMMGMTAGCRIHMPHAYTWPAGGDIQQTHAKPPEGGYHKNWDPYATKLEVTPAEDVNPVRTQHVLVATITDENGNPLPNRRVEWIISEGSVGDIVEVDESGWRASRGYKVDNHYAISHTNNYDHVLDMGNDDPSDDIHLGCGQTWCVITSPIEGDTFITAYAPGIYDWDKHKVFVVKHWYDVAWEFPPPATNPFGTTHDFVTTVTKFSDGSPLEGYEVTYKILDGPSGLLDPGGSDTVMVRTDTAGEARVTLRQTAPAEGTNNIEIDINRPADPCCKPAAHIATGQTSKTWVGPQIGISKNCPSQKMADEQFQYDIQVVNPSQVAATNVVVTDNLPEGIAFVSSNPGAQSGGSQLSWSLGSLGAGASQTISVTVHGTHTGTFDNCADVTADYGLSARDCCTTRIVSPKLVLEKQCPAEVMLCDPIQYTLIVRNTGDGPANNVQVVDELPDGLVTDAGRRAVRADVGTLDAGQAKQMQFTLRAERTGEFVNRARATADGGLTAEADCVTVVHQPVLEVTKSGPNVRYIGRTAKYTITVRNTGDFAARQTTLTDNLPSGATFISASDGGRESGGMLTWDLGTLEPGASRQVTVTVKAMRAGTVRNTATAKAVCAEASASTEMQVKGIPAILLEVVDVEDPIEIGATITYVITVTNQGSAMGTGITLDCTLPAEESYSTSDGPTQAVISGQSVRFAPLPSLAPKARATYRIIAKGTEAGDLRFKVSMTSDQTTSPVEETESTHVY